MRVIIYIFLCLPFAAIAQNKKDSTFTYKKRVLENVEIDMLSSFYTQNGNNAAVTGGIGTERLDDFAENINIAIPLNDDDIMTIDATISAYTSASSSNLNPFTGASGDDDDDDKKATNLTGSTTGTPWVESSGASKEDVWVNGIIGYSHYSDNRNNIYSTNLSFANEYDYTSVGGSIGYVRLFNNKNTELNFVANIFLDQWRPEYPIEIKTYIKNNGDLNADIFNGVDILDAKGNIIDKTGLNVWAPTNNTLIENNGRNTYSLSFSFSQILSKRMQISLFSDVVIQKGWLANPMQRVYFSDSENFYIGNPLSINNYTDPSNIDVFQLADDIERLPKSRTKIPAGVRLNYFINEFLVLRTYYRYYYDDWGISSNTFNIELPVKIGTKFTFYPNYRFYTQTAADYFAPFEQHKSTEEFYTSDFDLSEFTSTQYGFGIKYTDILTEKHIWKIALKSVSLNYSYYERITGLKAHILSFGIKLIID
ncbi:MAG: DUF3570 domain-containing protein [Bacteroidales bacterium]|nr:DUF3570 domain-containing protein [Bacteroidales bacterium]